MEIQKVAMPALHLGSLQIVPHVEVDRQYGIFRGDDFLAALECVDYVTWFDEDTPLKLIIRLHPDYLVKGGDWKPSEIVGSDEVLAWGGKVRSLPFVDGYSTTRLIEKSSR